MAYQRCYGNVRLLGNGPCLSNIEKLDGNAMPMVMAMAATGLQVDLNHFARMEKELERDLDKLTEDVKKLVGFYVNIDSPQQVSEMLFKRLGLKQARPKMTKGGDRESTENEVLVAIQHDHPVVPMLLDYKELSKLLGTYVRPMPKLARKTAFGEWRMFPNFKTTRVPSGRLACSEPNLLAMPTRTERGKDIRKGFIAKDGWRILSCDHCLHPDTEIWIPGGRKKIRDIKIGEPVLTHRDRKIHWGKITKVATIAPLPAYRITLDNGESIVASFDHRWPTLTSKKRMGRAQIVIKTTEELAVGERMVPCKEGNNGAGYKTWYSESAFRYEFQHHLVAEAYYGPRPEGHEVHHINEDRSDNAPGNLEYKSRFEHRSEHTKELYKHQDHTFRIDRLREGIKHRRTYDGAENPNSKLSEVDREVIAELVASDGWTASQVAEHFALCYGHARKIVKRLQAGENHKVVDIRYVGVQPMHAITVEPDHNYVLACGIVSQNSQIEVRIAAHRSEDSGLISIYEHDEDIYSDFATTAFRLPDSRYYDETEGKWVYPGVLKMEHRYPAKTCILAALYDVTAGGLLEQMPVVCANCNKEATQHDCGKFKSLWHEGNCQDLLNAFYLKYPGILRMRKADHRIARKLGYMYGMWGRLLHVAAVHSSLDWVVSKALREVGNFGMQDGAQGCLKLCMAETWDMTVTMGWEEVVHPLLQVHDELIWECREDVVKEFGNYCMGVFENCVRLLVPVKAGVEDAQTWGDLKK